MSRIDDLLQELCPSGVAFCSVSDVAKYVRGITYSKHQEQTDGPVCVLRSNNITLSSNTLSFDDVKRVSSSVKVREDQRLYADDILISAASGSKAHVGKVAFIYEDIDYVFGGFMAVLRTNGGIMPRFLFHLLIGKSFSDYLDSALSTTTINNLNATIMGGFRIPVPPLEIQREIVRNLDTFSKLEAELEAELEARSQQYAFYRDRLLSFDEDVTRASFGDVATIVRGASPRPIQAFISRDEDGVPWIKIGDVPANGKYVTNTAEKVTPAGAAKSRRVRPGDFILSNSMSFGRPYIVKIEGCIHDGWLVISGFEEAFLPDFLYHLLRSKVVQAEFARKAGSGTVQNLNADIVRSVTVPVPSMDEQEKIVAILDRFEVLTNDFNNGLPAELNARRQQYEHYRDRLLTFQEVK